MASLRVAQILSGVGAGATEASSLPFRLVTACAKALPISGAGLVLMTDSGPAGMIATTDGPAANLEELQFTLGEGPCLDCSRTGRPVLVPDLARSGSARWPAYTGGALDVGIRAIFAFPLRVGGIRVGVLDLYRDRSGVLTGDELAEALSFADAATAILLHMQTQGSVDGSTAVAIPVLEDRAEVHQATGMVAEQGSVPLTEALVLLRARAFASGRPIIAVARDVLAGTLTLAAEAADGLPEH